MFEYRYDSNNFLVTMEEHIYRLKSKKVPDNNYAISEDYYSPQNYVNVNYDSLILCQTIILVISCVDSVEFLRISLPIVCSY